MRSSLPLLLIALAGCAQLAPAGSLASAPSRETGTAGKSELRDPAPGTGSRSSESLPEATPEPESPSGRDLPGLKIVSVTPGAGLAGTQILLVGTGFGATSNAPLSIRFDGVSVPRGQIFRLSDDQIYVAIPPTATRSLLEVRVGERAALAPEPIDRLENPRVLPQDLVLGGDATADVRLVGTDHGGRIRDLQPYLWTLATPEDVATGESSLHDHSRGDPHRLQGLTIDEAGHLTSSRPRPGLYWIVAHVGSTHATTSLTVPPEGGAP